MPSFLGRGPVIKTKKSRIARTLHKQEAHLHQLLLRGSPSDRPGENARTIKLSCDICCYAGCNLLDIFFWNLLFWGCIFMTAFDNRNK